MDKISVYLLDTRKFTLSELISFTGLNEDELKRFERFKVLESKKEKIGSFYFKKKYVGDYFLNKFDKPISNNIFFNISHSKGVVVLVTSKTREVGVDIEHIRETNVDLINFISSEEEKEFIRNEIDFYSIWTNKESLVKCLGTGLKTNVKTIPALPLDGVKTFKDELYRSKVIKENDSIISLTAKGENDFVYKINKEN